MLRKIIIIIFVFLVILCVQEVESKSKHRKVSKDIIGFRINKFPFFIYSNRKHTSYYVLSGYLGDVVDLKVLKVKDPYTFKTCMKIKYNPTYCKGRQGWAGIFWQWPPNNWGDNNKGGYNLTGAKFLYFYARGHRGNELVEFKMGGIKGPYGDSDEATTSTIALTKKWELYKIDLKGKDLNNIIGGFAVLFNSYLNQEGAIVYLNDIYYTKKLKPERKFFIDYLQTETRKKK